MNADGDNYIAKPDYYREHPKMFSGTKIIPLEFIHILSGQIFVPVEFAR